MKRIAYISALALALSACTAEPYNDENGERITIEATMAENDQPKTVIQDGTGVYWEPGDEIKLFFDGIGSRFTSGCTAAAEKMTFTGTLNVSLGFNEGFSDATPLWGLYPYRADATSDNSSVTTTLPSEQTGRAGSFAKGTFITLARSQSLKMGFYNVCGGVRFSLVNDNIKEVVFEGKNDENLAGKVKLIFDGGYPAVSKVENGEKSITLTAPGGGCFEKGKWYYIVALPGTLSNGFKMTFNTADEYAVRSSSSSVTIKRGVFGNIEDVDQGLVFIEKGSSVPVPEMVDLGLPSGLKWASFNLGASNPEEGGDYYAWGETETYYETGYAQENPQNHWESKYAMDGYWWSNYKWCDVTSESLIKYNTNLYYGQVDNKIVLESCDDVAHVKLGGKWRMPTKEDFEELINNCIWTLMEQNNVFGYKVASSISGYTNKSIFLPFTCKRRGLYLDKDPYGNYWSSSLTTGYPCDAYILFFTSNTITAADNLRSYGFPVRPVSE